MSVDMTDGNSVNVAVGGAVDISGEGVSAGDRTDTSVARVAVWVETTTTGAQDARMSRRVRRNIAFFIADSFTNN